MTVFLDSWAWIEYLQNGPAADRVEVYLKNFYDLMMSAVNVAEVHCFLLREGKDDLLPFIIERALIVPVSAEIAQEAAVLKVKNKMGLADAIVLATAQKHRATIVTGDPHFKGMENVVYLGP